ncbi:MAG: YfhO family protein [Lachnospiraceae bacterium]|nr:YfhO family protein [Lachnospiraceae bacterium]
MHLPSFSHHPSTRSSGSRTYRLVTNPLFTLFFFTNAVFFLLYREFIFGDAVFMYSDVGSDSLSSSYPIIAELSRLFKTRTFSFYTIWSGLGQDTTATFLQYINPFKLMLLFFGRDGFPAGIMIYLFIQYNLTAASSYGAFSLLSGSPRAALLPALAWTYSSYIVVWGQNYSYGCCILMFSIMMYLLERVLCRETLLRWLFLTLWYALFFISNYYFFYMSGIFCAFYVFFRSLFRALDGRLLKKGEIALFVRKLFVKELKLAASAAAALAISAAPLCAIAVNFFGSARTGSIGAANLRSLLLPYDLHTYGTYLARLFSADLIGAGSAFSGSASYYDAALLSSTLLVFFAIVYLLFQRRSLPGVLILSAVSFLMLYFQGSGRILTFNPISQRYSFLNLYMAMIALVFFMRSLLDAPSKKKLLAASFVSPILIASLLLALSRGQERYQVSIRKETLLDILAFLVLWTLLMFSISTFKQLKKLQLGLMLLLLAAELLVLGSTSLYDREYLTRESFRSGFYNDGTAEAAALLKEEDPELYRICAGESYDQANEGLVDGYMSSSSYSNTTSASAISLSRTFSSYELSSNFFRAGYRNYYLFTLLGGRYLISDEPDKKADSLEPPFFSLLHETDTQRTFVNNNALPFGYLYENELTREDFAELSSPDRMKALASSYIYTDNIDFSLPETAAAGSSMSRFDLLPNIHTVQDASIAYTENGIVVSANGPDPYFFMNISDVLTAKNSEEVQYLHISVDPATIAALGDITFELFTMTEDHPDLIDALDELISVNAASPEMNYLLPDGTTILRLDMPEGSEIAFRDISLLTDPDASKDFESLKNTDISEISFEDDCYRALVRSENGGMLCVPLLYSANWSASVNGAVSPVENINGGLIGIPLEPGSSKIELRYAIPHFGAASAVSFLSLGIWLALLVFGIRKNRTGAEMI